ncbi:membrane protein of ER body-like protein isoform X2 [Cynara cardunculus var. scolymus]|uniref:membrane protein of ER body-like protein isoform X2 n=1 Tax=Cynara cardunculus var. scolymus TaxID=59895 RepID=UPI000D623C87|nr:membrane protein of ER body-like protein isoform X2 [Cynara cardunculus var. scolymus]
MEVEQQQEADELDQSLIPRKRNLHQTPFSTNNSSTFDGEMSSSSSVDGEEWKQQGEDEVVQDFIQQNGIKIDEDETEKEKQEYCVYYDTDKGTGLHGESSANGIDSTAHEKNHLQENTNVASHNQENGNGLYHVVNNQNAEHQNQNAEHQKHDEFSDGNLQPSEISFDKSSPSYINIETESSDIEVIKDVENEITEFDVETVLKKQDTHDLYCPNCNSCITKRVILRKRKRRIPAPGEDAKRNKSETPIPSQVNVVSSNSQAQNGSELSLDDVQPPASNEYDHQIEPDVFRCLSCFSIFMPTGTGFKLFRMFGNKSDEENNQRSQKQVGVKKHWFSSIFASDKVDQSNNEGVVKSFDRENNVSSNLDELNVLRQETSSRTTDATMHLEGKAAADHIPSSSLHDPNSQVLVKDQVQSAPSSTQESVTIEQVNAEESNNTNIGRIADTHDQLLTSYHIDSNAKSDYPGMFVVMPPANNNSNNGEPTDDDISSLQHDGLRLVVPPNVGSLIIDNSQMNQELDVTVQMNTSAESTNTMSEERTVQNNVEIHLEQPLKDVLTDKQIKVEELKKNESIEGKDTVITIDSKQLDPSSHQRSPGETGTSALQHVESGSQQGDATTLTGGRSLEIVKSMVYGGLMESIASLSVVSSAAGANADTLNVLALGLANIFGGLFVISHDLWDLKAERTRGSSEDRYQQLLGRRADFALHMVVCLLSYLVFGFLPPVVYGFSFRESNNRDLKLVMVAAASVICIMILAAGKAYVQNKSYFKTIAYYVTFGFMVSGASYLFGDLIVKLLEKMGIFHSGSVVNLVSIHGMNSKPALATF